MISPISGTQSIKQTSQQNITRDTEIKNKLTVTRGAGEVDNRGKQGKGQVKDHVEGPMDKDNGGGLNVQGVGRAGESNGGKMRTALTEQQLKNLKKE